MKATFSLVIALAVPLLAFPQAGTGSFWGDVRDPSGAVISGAGLKITNESTASFRSTETSALGAFRVDDLLPGRYRVEAMKPGFRTLVVEHAALEVNQKARLDLRLELGGGEREAVTVTARPGLVQSDGATESHSLDSASVSAVPLEGRNVVSLITAGPGAIPRQLGGFVHDLINDQQGNRGAVALNPPVNGARSTANSFVLDGAYNTDQTVFAAVVVPPLESVQEFHSQTSLNPASAVQARGGVVDIITKSGSPRFHGSAFEFLRNEATDALGVFSDPTLPRSVFRQNQFGAAIGGPIPIARDTFFFATYEGLRNRSAKASLHLVPDQVVRGGDFTRRSPIFDPLNLDAGGFRAPFAGNRLPASRLDPIALKFLSTYEPLPNHADVNGANYLDATPGDNNTDSGLFRVDRAFAKGWLVARYAINDDRSRASGYFPQLPTDETLRAQQAVVGYTSVFGKLVNEARAGFTRLRVFDVPESAFQSNVIQSLGIPNAPNDPFTFGLPYFLVTNFDTVTDSPTLPQVQRDNTWSFADSVSFTRGRHTFQAGLQWVNFQLNYLQSQFPRGEYQYDGVFTTGTNPTTADNSGDAFADFLLGFPQSTQRYLGNAQAYLRRTTTALYVQDDFRVSSRLTLNLGLRWEHFSPFTEARGNLFNLDYSHLPSAPTLRRVGQAMDSDWANFSPRAGLALRLPAGFVFRGGYGIYFQPEIATESYNLVRNGQSIQVNQTSGALRPTLTTRDGFPQSSTAGLPTYFGLDPHAATPYAQQWNAGFQRQLPGGVLVEASYVAAKGTHLARFRTFNTPAHVETGENLGPRPGDLQSLRTFPQFGPLYQVQHISNSIYHSLQWKAEKRFSHGLSFLASYVWAKSIDDADSPIPGQFDSFGAQDERNLRLERGLSFFDIRHRLSAVFVYQLPAIRALRALTSNWQTSGILTAQTGTPLNPVYFATDYANSGTPNRPNVVPGQHVDLGSRKSIDEYFNRDAFSDPAPNTFGNAGRNILPGPGNSVLNFALQRRFRLFEGQSVQVRAEAFNALNHPNWGIPGPNPDFGPYFGKILAAGDQRRLQFALRYEF